MQVLPVINLTQSTDQILPVINLTQSTDYVLPVINLTQRTEQVFSVINLTQSTKQVLHVINLTQSTEQVAMDYLNTSEGFPSSFNAILILQFYTKLDRQIDIIEVTALVFIWVFKSGDNILGQINSIFLSQIKNFEPFNFLTFLYFFLGGGFRIEQEEKLS